MKDMERREVQKDVFDHLKVGDVIVVRTKREMIRALGRRGFNSIDCSWCGGMSYMSGEEITITQEIFDRIHSRDVCIVYMNGYSFSIGMFKIKDVIIEEKKEEIAEKNESAMSIVKKEKDQNIINKMIEMVDMNRFVKLLSVAGSDEDSKKVASKKIAKDYIDRWAISKYEYFIMFGEKLTIEKEIELEMNREEIQILLESLYHKFPKYSLVLKQFSNYEFMENKIKNSDDHFEKYASNHFKIGMKLSKFLSSLLNDEAFDIELSKVLQNKTVKGRLNISIDPYDFLTMSINQHGWRSCHNIANGEYATGGFSYMCDDTTLIAYKDKNEIFEYKHHGFSFKGNSKSWRQCIYFDKSTCSMIFGRQYPNDSDGVAKEVRLIMEEIASKYICQEDKWTFNSSIKDDTYEDISDFHFSDVMNDYSFKFVKLKSLKPTDRIKFNVGSKVYCVYSGKELSDAEYTVRSDEEDNEEQESA
jgi:hypothetical protein